MHGYPRDRRTDAPLSVDVSGEHEAGAAGWAERVGLGRSWAMMGAYLGGGIFLGVLLILGLNAGGRKAAASPAATGTLITDNIVHLHARDIADHCWAGYDRLGPARLTVALDVGVDGKVRRVAASGETPGMRACVEIHMRAWEFLPQAQTATMALPVEIDRR